MALKRNSRPEQKSTGFMLGFLLALSGCLWADTEPIDRIVAIVNSDVILESELEDRIRAIKSRPGDLPPEDDLQKQVLDQLILDSIQLQMGAKSGIRVGDEDLTRAIQAMASGNNMTFEQLQEELVNEGMDYQFFREQVRQDLIIQEVQRWQLSRRIRVTPDELDAFIDSEAGRKVISDDYLLGHILIPVERRDSRSKIDKAKETAFGLYREIKDGGDFRELAEEYSGSSRTAQGGSLGWRKADEIPDLFAKQAVEMEVGDVLEPLRSDSGFHIVSMLDKRGPSTEIEQQYNVRHVLIKTSEILDGRGAQKLSQDIYRRAKAGEDFAELARLYSDDPGSGLAGGELGWVTKESLVPEFAATVEAAEIGEFSEPFETEYGWHVLQVLDEREHDISQDSRKQKALDYLRNLRFQEELKNFLTDIRNDAYIEIK